MQMTTTAAFKRMFTPEIEEIWKQKKAVVYVFENSVSGRVYVGTTTDIRERLLNHIRKAEVRDYKFYRSIRKHGWDTFDFYVIEYGLTQRRGLFLEMKWISALDSFRNGYNLTMGGDGASSGEDHIWARKIKGFNLETGEELCWNWIGGAAEHLGVGVHNIHKMLTTVDISNKQAYNFDKTERWIFKYEEDETPWDISTRSFFRSLVVHDIESGEITKIKSIAEAARHFGIDHSSISTVLSGKTRQFYSPDKKNRYDVQYDPPTREWNHIPGYRLSVIAYKDGVFIREFETADEAAKVLKLHTPGIAMVARHKHTQTGGYVFEYSDPILRDQQPPRPVPNNITVFYMKDGEKISFKSIRQAVRVTRGEHSISRRYNQISKSIGTGLPDSHGIQWFKSV